MLPFMVNKDVHVYITNLHQIFINCYYKCK